MKPRECKKPVISSLKKFSITNTHIIIVVVSFD